MLYTKVVALNPSSSGSKFWSFKHYVLPCIAIIVLLPKENGGDILNLSISTVFNAYFWMLTGSLPNFYFGLPQGGILITLRRI